MSRDLRATNAQSDSGCSLLNQPHSSPTRICVNPLMITLSTYRVAGREAYKVLHNLIGIKSEEREDVTDLDRRILSG